MSMQLFELILAIKRKCQSSEYQIQKDLGLSPAIFGALLVLQPDETILVNELAERMALSPSRSSRVLTKLMEKKYVNAKFKPDDRRSVEIILTASGKKTKSAIIKRMQECETRICSNLEDCQIDEIKSSLELLLKAL
ncbi:MarR family transcriptional regulator [candidate division KSB1 bacterium]|nr:MarR family transcriptional regulator [candidate division KSB1 bacterium]